MLIVCTFDSSAQVEVGATPTGKHAKAINTLRETRAAAKKRKKQAEKYQAQIKAREEYRKKYDSLMHLRINSAKDKYNNALDLAKTDTLGSYGRAYFDSVTRTYRDSLQFRKYEWTKEDSLEVSEFIISQSKYPEEYEKLLVEVIVFDSSYKEVGKRELRRFQGEAERTAIGYLPDEVPQQDMEIVPADPLKDDELNENALTASLVKFKPNPFLVQPDQARQLMSSVKEEDMNVIRDNLDGLKKKYSSVSDSRDLSTGIKRNSLQDMPVGKRFHFGGNFNVTSTDPVIIASNLQVGYWINKKWLAGVGFIVQEQFNDRDSLSIRGDSRGYSVFSRYDVLQQFFIWGELERQINKSLFHSDFKVNATWQQAYLLGVGREFSLGPLMVTTLLLYDFNHRQNELNARPIVFKFGFRLNQLNLIPRSLRDEDPL